MATAGFSGRVLDERASLHAQNAFNRSTVFLPRQHGLQRVAYRRTTLQCNAIALGDVLEWSLLRNLARIFSLRQMEQVNTELVQESSVSRPLNTQAKRVGTVIKEASLSAIQIGLTLTGAALHLASKVVFDLQSRAQELRARKAAEQQKAVAQQQVMDVQTKLKYEIQRKRLEAQGKDKAFVSMLRVLDRCHLDHDVKWSLVQKHTADKAEFSERLQQLYNLAEASKDAVDHLLRPDASRKEINTFWKSPETVAIIAEEDKLKSLVFAQMLQASS